MVTIPNPAEINSLEFIANNAFEALKQAVSTMEPIAIAWARSSFSNYDRILVGLTGGKHTKQGEPNANLLDRYTIQVLIGIAATDVLLKNANDQDKAFNPDVTEETLRKAIENGGAFYYEDKLQETGGADYEFGFYSIASDLALLGQYDVILKSFEHVRETYPKPEV